MPATEDTLAHVPMGLPHPATRPSREEVNDAIEAGLSPIIVQGDRPVMLGDRARIPRMIGDYRNGLRSHIAGMDWDAACAKHRRSDPANQEEHKGNLLIWGYQALCAERDAATEFVAMGTDFAEARKALGDLLFAFRQDGRIMDGIPLPIAIKANIEHCDQHVRTLHTAFRQRHARAAQFLRDWCASKLAWMTAKGVVVSDPSGKGSQYHLNQMALTDLANLEAICAYSAELAESIEKWGISGVIRQQRQGNRGRLPTLLEAWLVQQGDIAERRG